MRDSDVRAAVRSMLDNLHSGDANTRVVEEMGVWSGSVRIDVAVINGELSGFEIKSDRDTLHRLPQQVELYSRVFDRLVLVVGSKHAQKAMVAIPDWWGVTIAFERRDRIGLEHLRVGEINPLPDPYLVAKLLWKEEALAVLDVFNLARGWRSKTVDAIHARLAVEVPFVDLAAHVRASLKRRKNWLGQSIGDEREVSASDEGRPLRSAARIDRVSSDLFNTIITPATN